MRVMNLRSIAISVLLAASLAAAANGQHEPVAKNARILLLPRKMVSGDRATLAVLDVNGRLTPGGMVAFSNGDHVTTNATGRGIFVATDFAEMPTRMWCRLTASRHWCWQRLRSR